MTSNPCPKCGAGIPAANINMTEGVGLCASCGKLSRLSEIVDHQRDSEILDEIPKGCSTEVVGDEIRLRATLRSLGVALGVLFFALFWNGIVSVFVLVAISGLYKNLVGPLPTWFPAPSMINGQSQLPLGETLFMCIFLMPFIGVGLLTACATITAIAGHIEVRISTLAGSVRTAVGPIGWTRRFDPSKVRDVAPSESAANKSSGNAISICIKADREIKFGTQLTEERREWLCATLYSMLVAKKNCAAANLG